MRDYRIRFRSKSRSKMINLTIVASFKMLQLSLLPRRSFFSIDQCLNLIHPSTQSFRIKWNSKFHGTNISFDNEKKSTRNNRTAENHSSRKKRREMSVTNILWKGVVDRIHTRENQLQGRHRFKRKKGLVNLFKLERRNRSRSTVVQY